MAYQNPAVDWLSKEKRELFAKATNSMIMSEHVWEKLAIEDMLEKAKLIVDTAFTNYPDKSQASQQQPNIY